MDHYTKTLISLETKQNGQDQQLDGLEKRTDEIDI